MVAGVTARPGQPVPGPARAIAKARGAAAGTRTVRGGTEQYYRRAFSSLRYDDAAIAEMTFRALAAEIATAEPDAFLMVRALRLSPERAEEITATLRDLADNTDEGGDYPQYGLLLGLYQPAQPDGAGLPAGGQPAGDDP